MKKLLVTATIILLLSACYNDKYDKLYPSTSTNTCDTTTIGYSHDIVPILTTYCNISGGCHDAGGASVSGFNFSTYSGLARVANATLLLNDINQVSGHNAMPKNGLKLSDCNINKFTRWVNQGSQNN